MGANSRACKMTGLEMYTRNKTYLEMGVGKGFGGTSHYCLATTPLLPRRFP